MRFRRADSYASLVLRAAAVFLISAGAARAATIWNGPPISFTKTAGSDPNLAANQDRITANFWLTRAGFHWPFLFAW